jgi:2-amino-4-hydroxy-6-hydroxymethyldihydropteridine diphosphokinase
MDGGWRQALIGVGANLGDRWAAICAARAALEREPGITVVGSSGIYETVPVGVLDQPLFLNLVLGVATGLAPEDLLAVLQALEKAAGRRRELEIRWGPRPLDLDLLLYEGETRSGPELTLPHPRIWERDFVTVPLCELLDKVAGFDRPVWTGVRARLALLPPAKGVIAWTPPET